jgi:tight adherence protein C
MNLTLALRITTLIATAVGLAVGVYQIARVPAAPRPTRGARGLRRAQAMQAGGSFARVEPLVRFVAALLSRWPAHRLRSRLDTQIARAGDYLGFSPDEFLAAMVLSSALCTAFACAVVARFDLHGRWILVSAMLGAYLPCAQLRTASVNRAKHINRGLPAAIDLAALCMGAGLDFVGALKQIIHYQSGQSNALREELARILQELELGHTRKQALSEFANRVPTESVKDFVSAVIQSEEKGNPLADVLRIQATMLRMRRSVAAEEAAARAGTLMMVPLVMILGSILIVLFGPFVLTNMRSGF